MDEMYVNVLNLYSVVIPASYPFFLLSPIVSICPQSIQVRSPFCRKAVIRSSSRDNIVNWDAGISDFLVVSLDIGIRDGDIKGFDGRHEIGVPSGLQSSPSF